MAVTKMQPLATCSALAVGAADNLDQRHLRHRIEKVNADQATRIAQRLGNLFDLD